MPVEMPRFQSAPGFWPLLAVALGAVLALPVRAGELLSASRQRELVHVVRQDCGSCHGLTLQGGLGSPLTAAALRDKPAESLAATILQGRPGTAMPPFQSLLQPAEVEWIVQQLQRGFPEDKE